MEEQDKGVSMGEGEDDALPSVGGSVEEEAAFATAAVNPKQVWTTDEELKALQRELTEYKDKYLRSLAEAENARKRLQKERQEITRLATENLIIDFIRPLDNLENALKFAQEMPEEIKRWAFGFQMILAQFKDVLVQNGVAAIDALGKPFNPHDHEAIEMVKSAEQPPGIVVEECLKGYKMGDRTIRAARVKVTEALEK